MGRVCLLFVRTCAGSRVRRRRVHGERSPMRCLRKEDGLHLGSSEGDREPARQRLRVRLRSRQSKNRLAGGQVVREFEAERARFEDRGFLLPPLEPVDRFDGTANVDPRYNSLNVIAGDLVVSVELLGTEPWDPTEQLALEKRRGQLSAGSRSPSRLARPAVRGDAGKRACPQAVDSSNSCKSS